MPLIWKSILLQRDATERLLVKWIVKKLQVFEMDIVDIGRKSVLLQCVHTEKRVDRLIEIFAKQYPNNIIVVRGGAVAIGAINVTER